MTTDHRNHLSLASRVIKTTPESQYAPITAPIHLSSSFSQPADQQWGEFGYQRSGNPTRRAAQEALADIEGARHALVFATGMAATSTVFSQLKSADRVLLSSSVYGGTFLFTHLFFEKRGLKATYVDDLNALSVEDVPADTAMIFLESPTNPTLRITDIRHARELADATGALLVVDNTFLTPYYQRPLELGADVVVHSATKYLSGHSDVLAGVVATNRDDLFEDYSWALKALGNPLSPFDCYSLLRGLKTLVVRMDRQEANALALRQHLAQHPAVARVLAPGWYSAREREIHTSQSRGDGALFSFELIKGANIHAFLAELHLINYAVSLGSVESLICHPAKMTHENLSPEERQKAGITDELLRFSVGIEGVDDLIRELNRALEAATGGL